MNDIKISIIVLTFNHEKYIEKAIDSILKQKVDFKYEILIADDCSNDGTQEVLKKFLGYTNIKVICREKNLGASRNLYEVLKIAKGKYIAHLEGDDFWMDNNKLQIQSNFLDENLDYVGTTHNIIVIDESGKCLNKKIKWISTKHKFTLNNFDGIKLPGQTSTLLYRNIFQKNIDSSILYRIHPLIADRVTILMLLVYGDFFRIDKEMSVYRMIIKKNGGNVTSIVYNSKNTKDVDFKITCRLEEYAHNVLRKNVNFTKVKCALAIKAFLKLLLKPNSENFNVLKNIYIVRKR